MNNLCVIGDYGAFSCEDCENDRRRSRINWRGFILASSRGGILLY